MDKIHIETNLETKAFKEFLELPERERLCYLLPGEIKLRWGQRIQIWLANKWWTYIRRMNPKVETGILWNSIYKGRW